VHNFIEHNRIRLMEMEWVDGYDLQRLLTPAMLQRARERVGDERWDYLNDGMPLRMRDQVGWLVTRVKPGSSGAEAALAIDKHFDSRDVQTLSQDERAFNASFLAGFQVILDALNWVSMVILVIMALILGNTIAMGVRERTSEYGTLRAIGFMPKHVVAFIVGEGVAAGAIGGLVGVACAEVFINRMIGPFLEENVGSLVPFFRLEADDAVVALVLAASLGFLASIIPAINASRLNVIQALRRVA